MDGRVKLYVTSLNYPASYLNNNSSVTVKIELAIYINPHEASGRASLILSP
jgi:hypothetical protein